MVTFSGSRSENKSYLVAFVEVLAGGGGACVRRAGQLLCGLTGHEMLLHFLPGRLCLRCASCGYESRGWTIGRRTSTAAAGAAPVTRPVRLEPRIARRAA